MVSLKTWLIRMLPGPIRYPVIRDLPYLLAQARPESSLEEKLLWLEKLFDWISHKQSERAARVRFVLHLLRKNPEWQTRVSQVLRSVIDETSGVSLFSDTGLPSEFGFLGEALDRVATRLLPRPPREGHLSELLARLFESAEDAHWLEDLPPETIAEIFELIAFQLPPETPLRQIWKRQREDMADALLLLTSTVRALTLSEDVRLRAPGTTIRDSAAILLSRNIENLVHPVAPLDENGLLESAAQCRASIEQVRGIVRSVFAHLEEFGLSVGLVYRLEKISAYLDRMEALIFFYAPKPGTALAGHGIYFLAHLVRGCYADRSIRGLVRTNLHLLSRKIAERTGATGEHYIVRSSSEYYEMLAAAGGGGVVTAGTTAIKYWVAAWKLPLFFDTFFSFLNYSSSFLLMQAVGFRLATKTSSVTAAALAPKIPRSYSKEEVDVFVTEVSQITRTQFAAALGNVGMVIPAAIALDSLYQTLFHKPVLDPATAQYVLHSLHPLETWTVPCAILTGFLLWLASVCAGWLENWSVYRQIPRTIRSHRALIWALGEKRAIALSELYARQIAGFGSNVSLGLFLAVTPMTGKFFGIPLDVRHLTLSSGAVALAVCSLGPDQASRYGLVAASTGIFAIGICNFAVSFSASIWVAIRARDIGRGAMFRLFTAVLRRLVRAPHEFFLPTRRA